MILTNPWDSSSLCTLLMCTWVADVLSDVVVYVPYCVTADAHFDAI